MQLLLVGVGGALGSAARFVIGRALLNVLPGFPLGTLIVNLVGCFCIGVVADVAERSGSPVSPEIWLLVVTGFLGGFTTFSAFGHETMLLSRTSPALAVINVVMQVGVGLGAVVIGRLAARVI